MRAVANLAGALRGADFVFISIQPGDLALMAHEIAVAERYGLFFPVGDTTGVQALVARHVANQGLIVAGALARDKGLIFQAICADPTTNLPIDQAWRMFEEIGLPEGSKYGAFKA